MYEISLNLKIRGFASKLKQIFLGLYLSLSHKSHRNSLRTFGDIVATNTNTKALSKFIYTDKQAIFLGLDPNPFKVSLYDFQKRPNGATFISMGNGIGKLDLNSG